MKILISQNGIKVCEKEVRNFVCSNCGAIFQSNSYTSEIIDKGNNVVIYRDECFTCNTICSIYVLNEEIDGQSKDF